MVPLGAVAVPRSTAQRVDLHVGDEVQLVATACDGEEPVLLADPITLRVTGDDCYFMRAWVRSVEHLEEVIDRFAPYGQTTTSIVQSSPVPPRGLPLRQEA